jgi:predicted anti-sigma-YlaC factor YlaD
MLDGEDPGMPTEPAREHAASCAGCEAFLAAATELRRRTRLQPAPELADVAPRVLASIAQDSAGRAAQRRRVLVARGALAALAVVQAGLAAPVLLLGRDQQAPLHVAHEVGSFCVAIAAGLLLAAVRPRLAGGMLPLVGVMSGLLLLTAAADVAAGGTQVVDEAPHLLVFAAFLVLWWLAKEWASQPSIGASPPGGPWLASAGGR